MHWRALIRTADVLTLNGGQHAKADQRNGKHKENGVRYFVVDFLAAYVSLVDQHGW